MLALRRDTPDFVLKWSGLPRGWFGQLFMVPLLFGIGRFMVFVFMGMSGLAEGKEPGVGGYILATFGTGFFLFVLGIFWIAFAQAFRHISAIELQRGEPVLRVVTSGILVFLEKTEIIPLEQTDTQVRIGPERKGAELRLWLDVRSDAERVEIPFKVKHLDRREEALDLVFRLATALGWPAYEVARSDPRGLSIRLRHEPGPSTLPVPTQLGESDYRRDILGARLQQPDLEVSPFNPAAYGGPCQIVEWEPGRRVEIHHPDPSHGGPWGALLDWTTRTARFTERKTESTKPFDNILRMVLRGRHVGKSRPQGKGSHQWYEYWTELWVATADGWYPVARTALDSVSDAPYESLLPMANDLAKKLGVPMEWNEYEDEGFGAVGIAPPFLTNITRRV